MSKFKVTSHTWLQLVFDLNSIGQCIRGGQRVDGGTGPYPCRNCGSQFSWLVGENGLKVVIFDEVYSDRKVDLNWKIIDKRNDVVKVAMVFFNIEVLTYILFVQPVFIPSEFSQRGWKEEIGCQWQQLGGCTNYIISSNVLSTYFML